MNPSSKQGNVAIQALILLIAIVATSATVLVLIQGGIISVKAQNSEVSLLNTEFIPIERQGALVITDFALCRYINENYECWEPGTSFVIGNEVHFRFTVQSGVYNGNILLVENYRLKDPNGNVILDVDQKNNFQYEAKSENAVESITFKDYFTINPGSVPGDYTLELIMSNPLLDKRAVVTKTFTEALE